MTHLKLLLLIGRRRGGHQELLTHLKLLLLMEGGEGATKSC